MDSFHKHLEESRDYWRDKAEVWQQNSDKWMRRAMSKLDQPDTPTPLRVWLLLAFVFLWSTVVGTNQILELLQKLGILK